MGKLASSEKRLAWLVWPVADTRLSEAQADDTGLR